MVCRGHRGSRGCRGEPAWYWPEIRSPRNNPAAYPPLEFGDPLALSELNRAKDRGGDVEKELLRVENGATDVMEELKTVNDAAMSDVEAFFKEIEQEAEKQIAQDAALAAPPEASTRYRRSAVLRRRPGCRRVSVSLLTKVELGGAAAIARAPKMRSVMSACRGKAAAPAPTPK